MGKVAYRVIRVQNSNRQEWLAGLPFFVNPRGWLVHRVREAATQFLYDGEPSHYSIGYWCGGATCNTDVSAFASEPGDDRLLCVYCEAQAVAAGMPSAEELVGRHVHLGRTRAVRVCCESDN